jgi:hypothetical protein
VHPVEKKTLAASLRCPRSQATLKKTPRINNSHMTGTIIVMKRKKNTIISSLRMSGRIRLLR